MRGTLALAAVGTLLLSMAAFPAVAQTTNWASVTSVRDITGNATLHPGDSLTAGDSYNVTMNIAVPFSQSASKFTLSLNQALNRSGSQYWYVLTPAYPGYNATGFTGGQQTVTFGQVRGNLSVSAVFNVPKTLNTQKFGDVTLHMFLQNVTVVYVNVSGGGSPPAQVGQVMMSVSDQVIQKYQADYTQKSTLISSGSIDATYSNAVNSELAQAQTLYSLGLVEQADALILTIQPSNYPAPPNSSYVTYILVGLVLAAVLAVAFLVLFMRSRGKSGFYDSIASDVQKELAALEVTAAQYDQALADRLKRLRDRLGERL